MRMNIESKIEDHFSILHEVFVILSVSEESLQVLINLLRRFFTAFRMTITRLCHFDSMEKSPEIMVLAQEISPYSRNDNKAYGNDNHIFCIQPSFSSISRLTLILCLSALSVVISAQNIMQIKNAQGVINSSVVIPISITNDEEFISFQCDVLLPDGFYLYPQ